MEKIETLEKDDKPKKKKRRLKKWVKVTFSILTILIVFLAIVAIILSFLLSGASTKSEVVDFTVDSGSSVYSVGKKLEKEGIIRSYIAYKTYVKVKNIKSYKAGVYRLDKSLKVKDIVSILTGNYYKENGIKITFKEGNTITSIAKEIAKNTNVKESEFYDKINDETYIDELINKYYKDQQHMKK